MEQKSSCKIYPINILSIIDTDYILSNYPSDQEMMPDQELPEHPILVDSEAVHMICRDSRGPVNGEGTTNLSFQARKGDYIFFRGTSTSANSDSAIIIYNIQEEDHHHIFGPFNGENTSLALAAEPSSETFNGVPAIHRHADFHAFQSKIKKHGATTLAIQFGLYTLEDDGETQSLYGYFEWRAKIDVDH
ncbi:MAG TPA: AidA/PixA family protein [Niastella sp.]